MSSKALYDAWDGSAENRSKPWKVMDLDRDFTIALKRKYATLAKDVKIPVGRQLSIEFSYQSMGRAKTPSGATPLARN